MSEPTFDERLQTQRDLIAWVRDHKTFTAEQKVDRIGLCVRWVQQIYRENGRAMPGMSVDKFVRGRQ